MSEERRLVTILFADVVGSTALGESLDPEDTRALLARLFGIATEAVERHGGRVEKFIGDAVMAVFGVPVAHDDDPSRALSAAMELRDRVRADDRLGSLVPIRLGVNGGEVIASREEDARVLVTGDPVNVAARLQQAAEPWSILVSERTVRAAGERFEFGQSIAVEAKGKSAPIAARELRGVATGRPSHPKGRIVGRQADLEQLQLVAKRSFQERRPFLVSVVAPAGVGKSRLLEEFLDHLDPDVRVAMAQCLPYGQRLTYWPMRAILLSIVGLADDATPDAVRTELVSWLRASGEPDAERVAELLAATIGASEIEGDRIAVFAAWRRFVEIAAERQPLALVIEDLHWSSDSLLDLVESMLQPRADVPLMMIVLARPELLDRRPGWGGGRRNAVSITLEPLSSDAVEALVADLLDRPSRDIVDAVVARAEGNPFYAGEIVRSLVDRLGPAPDPASLAGAIAALPDTVHATVLARLDALEPSARRVVQLGAVIGRTFEPRAIPDLDPGLSVAGTDLAVDMLFDRDLVRPAARGAVTFRHILIREVAYQTLPRAERARIHGAAGRWFAADATATGRVDELAELVAFHLREAVTIGGLTGETVAEDLRELAVTWLRRAAEAAAAGAASPEAARHLNAAIEIAPKALQADLYERLGQIWNGGDQGAEAFEHAWAIGKELGLGADQELRTLAQALVVRARWTGSVGRPLPEEESTRRYERIRELLTPAASSVATLHAELALAFDPMRRNSNDDEELREAAVWAERAVASARRIGTPDLISAALDAAGSIALGRDDMREVLGFALERHAIEDRLSTGERADAWIVHTWSEAILGNLDASVDAADRARAGLASGQASSFVLGATAWRAFSLYTLGRWDEALAEAARAERSWQESEFAAPWYAVNGFLPAYAIARSRNDPVGADHWRELLIRLNDRSDPNVRTRQLIGYLDEGPTGPPARAAVLRDFRTFTGRMDYVYLFLATVADRRERIGVEHIDAIVDFAAERALDLVTAQALRARGVERQDGADLQSALAMFERMGARPFVARVRTELGVVLGDRALVDRGLDDLEALGDMVQAALAAGECQAAWPAGTGKTVATPPATRGS